MSTTPRARHEARDRRAARIERHNRILFRLGAKVTHPYNVLRRIETVANRLMEDYCNGEVSETGYDLRYEKIKTRVAEVFGGNLPEGFYLNSDPRGYALKLDDAYVRDKEWEGDERIETDWGGYGLLAPDFNDN